MKPAKMLYESKYQKVLAEAHDYIRDVKLFKEKQVALGLISSEGTLHGSSSTNKRNFVSKETEKALRDMKKKLSDLLKNSHTSGQYSEVWLRMMVDYYESRKVMEQSSGEYQNTREKNAENDAEAEEVSNSSPVNESGSEDAFPKLKSEETIFGIEDRLIEVAVDQADDSDASPKAREENDTVEAFDEDPSAPLNLTIKPSVGKRERKVRVVESLFNQRINSLKRRNTEKKKVIQQREAKGKLYKEASDMVVMSAEASLKALAPESAGLSSN